MVEAKGQVMGAFFLFILFLFLLSFKISGGDSLATIR